VILIDNSRDTRRGPGFRPPIVLPPLRIEIPRDRYVVDADRVDEHMLEETLLAPPVERVERIYSLDEVLQNQRLRQKVRRIDLNTINFETARWDVPDDQRARLDGIARALQAAIRRNPDEVFLIEGHTDAVGSDDDNLALSDRRAESVARVLTRYYRIPPENLVTQGYGEEFLKVDTQGPERENRRVTLRNITPLISASDRGR
jgi:outer membrane protein OmpA-like peptidoglycan-associated protein